MSEPIPTPHRIYLVEDHPLIRRGIAAVLEAEDNLVIDGETGSAEAARRRVPGTQPERTLIGPTLQDGSGLTLIEDLWTQLELPMLVLSAQDESLYVPRVLTAGAQGYLTKSEGYWTVVEAVRRILDGSIYLSDKMSTALLSTYAKGSDGGDESPLSSLSNRELEVFTLMGHGLGRGEIAEILSLSPKTVDTYRDHLKTKLSLETNDRLRRNAAVWVAQNAALPGGLPEE